MNDLSKLSDDAKNRLRILATGERGLLEFQTIYAEMADDCEFVATEDVESHLNSDYDILLLFVDRSERFSASVVANWVSLAPLLPMVAIHSSHNEGEPHSGSPWPGVIRVYWHKWPFQFGKYREQHEQQVVPDWNLPKTATLVDRRLNTGTLRKVFSIAEQRELELQIAVSTPLRVDFEMFRCEFEETACELVWIEQQKQRCKPDLLIIDQSSVPDRSEPRITQLISRYPLAKTILTMGYPRHQDVNAAYGIGIDTVVSKPFDSSELLWHAHQLFNLKVKSG